MRRTSNIFYVKIRGNVRSAVEKKQAHLVKFQWLKSRNALQRLGVNIYLASTKRENLQLLYDADVDTQKPCAPTRLLRTISPDFARSAHRKSSTMPSDCPLRKCRCFLQQKDSNFFLRNMLTRANRCCSSARVDESFTRHGIVYTLERRSLCATCAPNTFLPENLL